MSKGRSVKDKIVLAILITIFAVFALGILSYLGVVSGFVFNILKDELSVLPSKAIYKVFPEYDLEINDIEYIETGYWGLYGDYDYGMRTLSDEGAKTYIEEFRKVKVNLKWTEALDMHFKGEQHQLDGNNIVVFHLQNGEIRKLYINTKGNPFMKQRINDTNYYVMYEGSRTLGWNIE